MYSQADIERLELINELTGEGINLAGVIRILDLQGRLDERDQELDDLHKRVRQPGRPGARTGDARKRELARPRGRPAPAVAPASLGMPAISEPA